MSKKKEERQESILQGIYKTLGMIVVACIIITIPFFIGRAYESQHGSGSPEYIGMPYLEDPCEYRKGDLYFTGSCNDIFRMVDVDERVKEYSEYVERKQKELDEIVIELEVFGEKKCREVVKKNLYANIALRFEEQYGHLTQKEIDEKILDDMEEINEFIDVSCSIVPLEEDGWGDVI